MSESPARFVREFHDAYGVRVRRRPTMNIPELKLRIDLLEEEWEEYVEACIARDIGEMADALADMVYVIYGTALTHGIDLDAVLAEVHRSNMSKLGGDGKPVLRDDGKVIKGPNYSPPDIAQVLAAPTTRVAPVPGTARRTTRRGDDVKDQPNPDPELFTTFERLETCHRVEVTEDNIHRLARFFGCSVDYSSDVPVLREPSNHPVKVGDWLDWRGSRWNPEPLTQGWSPAGTFHPAPTSTTQGAARVAPGDAAAGEVR